MTGTATRIGIVTGNKLIQGGIESSLREQIDEYEIALVAESAVEAFAALERYHETEQPELHVMLISVTLPDMDGIELAQQLDDRWPLIRSIVMSDQNDAAQIERAIQKRVRGLFLTTEPVETLAEVIKQVNSGKRCYRCDLAPEVISSYQRSSPSTRNLETAITPRQIQVLGLICQGKTEREIAKDLGISHNTVHVHKNNIMQALQIHSKVGLVKYAAQHNLINL